MESFKLSRTAFLRSYDTGGAPVASTTPMIYSINADNSEQNIKIIINKGEHVKSIDEKDLEKTKTRLDNIDPVRYQYLRNNNNPYEKISFFFQNRAAFKLVELDHHFKLIPDEDTKNRFIMADICSGPGGFSEYALTKLKWKAKVFGFTLKKVNDFNVDKFNISSVPETFHPFYGVDGDGDITSLKNLLSLEERIEDKVDLVTADGGFEINDYNSQEIFARKMLFGEFLTPLMLLKRGGNFVCKLFTTFTEFSYDLIYLATCLYDNVFFVKPISSRVANSERFLVCKGFRGISPKLLKELQAILNIKGVIPPGSTQEQLPISSFLDHSSESWKKFSEQLDGINKEVTKTQIIQLVKIIKADENNGANHSMNVKNQKILAKKVATRMKIHKNKTEHSPDGYLYYDPEYGKYLNDPKVAIDICSKEPRDSLFLVKTKGRLPKTSMLYYLKDGKLLSCDLDLNVDCLPNDTIVEVKNDKINRIVYSFLPPDYGEPNYDLLAYNIELKK